MSIRLKRTKDWDLISRLHDKCFNGDDQPSWEDGSERAAWIAWDGEEPVGFCSAKLLSGANAGSIFLERAAVIPSARKAGLQRRMIKVRIRWARTTTAKYVITYASPTNFPSIVNLVKSDLRLYTPSTPWGVAGALYFQLKL